MVNKNTNFFEYKDNFKAYEHIESVQIVKSNLNRNPLITIVIPTYKRTDLLKKAIESALNQNSEICYEITIVDNNPERNCETELLIKEYNSNKINYYKNYENIGMFGNWNRCIKIARGEWISMLHDDDELDLEYINNVYRVINKKIDIGFIACRLNIINELVLNNKKRLLSKFIRNVTDKINPLYKVKLEDYIFGFNTYLVGSCFKKELAIKIGGFNPDYFPSTDYYFTVLFQHTFNNTYYIRKKIYNYRILRNESTKIDTGYKFIVSDYYFQNFLINRKKGLIPNLQQKLNYLYILDRLKTCKNIYKLELDSHIIEDKIGKNPCKNSIINKFGLNILKLISIYRALFKF